MATSTGCGVAIERERLMSGWREEKLSEHLNGLRNTIGYHKLVKAPDDGLHLLTYIMRDLDAKIAGFTRGISFGRLPIGIDLTVYHFLFNSEEDYEIARTHWPQQFTAIPSMALHQDWVWSKFKVQRGWEVHRIFCIRRRNVMFYKNDTLAALIQALSNKAGRLKFTMLDYIMKGLAALLPTPHLAR